MKLYYSPTSPYVRKVVIVAHETGQFEDLNLTTVATTPVEPNATVVAANPLGKIPALALDDGQILFDSRVIIDYLNDRSGGEKVIPAEGPGKWATYQRQALADGVLDAALLVRYETFLRPEALRWDAWQTGQTEKILRGVAAMAADVAILDESISLGHVAFGVALGYLDFRFPDLGWRHQHPGLATWYAEFAQRPSMQKTLPPD